ncbi:rho-related BTB domain-containing protein 1-like isoform X3 [Petromyzon marinus]
MEVHADYERSNVEVIKCVVVGDNAVGKTRLICARACSSAPPTHAQAGTHVPTVWAIDHYRACPEVLERSRGMVDDVNVSLRLWDTFGDHHKDRKFAYGRADVVVVCFSIASPVSLAHVRSMWIPEVRQFCPRTPILLAGLQLDLRYAHLDTLNRARRPFCKPLKPSDLLPPDRGREVARSFGLPYYEASVMAGGVGGAGGVVEEGAGAPQHHGVRDIFDNAIRVALLARRGLHFWKTQLKRVRPPLLQAPFLPPKPPRPHVEPPPPLPTPSALSPRPSLSPSNGAAGTVTSSSSSPSSALAAEAASSLPSFLLTETAATMVESERAADVVFEVAGERVYAHKVFLAMACSKFQELFTSEFANQIAAQDGCQGTNDGGGDGAHAQDGDSASSHARPSGRDPHWSRAIVNVRQEMVDNGFYQQQQLQLGAKSRHRLVVSLGSSFPLDAFLTTLHFLYTGELRDEEAWARGWDALNDGGDDAHEDDADDGDGGGGHGDIDTGGGGDGDGGSGGGGDDDDDNDDDDDGEMFRTNRRMFHRRYSSRWHRPIDKEVARTRRGLGAQGDSGVGCVGGGVGLSGIGPPTLHGQLLSDLERRVVRRVSALRSVAAVAEALEVFDLRVMVGNELQSEAFMNTEVTRAFHTRRANRLRDLLARGTLADVVFRTDNGLVPAHKPLLIPSCEWMAAMFSGAFIENFQDEVRLPGTSRACVRALLEYLYTRHVTVSHELNLMELIGMGNRLCMARLVHLAEFHMVRRLEALSDANKDINREVLISLELTQLHNAERLAGWLRHHVCTNFNTVCREYPVKMMKMSAEEELEALLLNLECATQLPIGDGAVVEKVESFPYLGSVLMASSGLTAEVSLRISQRIWRCSKRAAGHPCGT